MKRLQNVALTALVVLAAACGGASSTGSTGKHYKITLIAGTTADNFYVTMNCGAQTEAKRQGVTYQFTGPNHFDPASQIPVVSSVTAQHPDAVLIASKYAGINVLSTQYDNDDQAKAAQILTATYAAHPDLVGIFAANTISAEGVATGIRNAGAVGKIKTVGFDAEPQSIQDLNNDVVQ